MRYATAKRRWVNRHFGDDAFNPIDARAAQR